MTNHIIILLLQMHQGLPVVLKSKTNISKVVTRILQGLASTYLSSFISKWSFSSTLALLMEPSLVQGLCMQFLCLEISSLIPHPSYPLITQLIPLNLTSFISSSGKPSWLSKLYQGPYLLLLKHRMFFLGNHCILCNLTFIWIII